MSGALEQRVTAVEDRLAISQLRSLYCYYVDQRRWDDLAALFTEDCEFKGRLDLVKGRDALVEYFTRAVQAMEASWHRTLNETLVLDGDTASGSAYFDAPAVVNGVAMLSAGRYDDEFAKQDGSWRFKRRTISFFYFTPFSEGWSAPEPDEVASR
jgi:hypothetical protein